MPPTQSAPRAGSKRPALLAQLPAAVLWLVAGGGWAGTLEQLHHDASAISPRLRFTTDAVRSTVAQLVGAGLLRKRAGYITPPLQLRITVAGLELLDAQAAHR